MVKFKPSTLLFHKSNRLYSIQGGFKMTTKTLTESRKHSRYTQNEGAFLEACAQISIDNSIKVTDVARCVHMLFGRTSKAIEQQVNKSKNNILEKQGKKSNVAKKSNKKIKNASKASASTQTDLIDLIEEKKLKPNANVQRRDAVAKNEVKHEPIGLERINQRVMARVYKVTPYGAFCETEEGKSGLIIKGMISSKFVEDVSDYLQIGDVFEAVVVKDVKNENKVLLNARLIQDITPIKERD